MTQEELEKLEKDLDKNIKTLISRIVKDPKRANDVKGITDKILKQIGQEPYIDQILNAQTDEELSNTKISDTKAKYDEAMQGLKDEKDIAINDVNNNSSLTAAQKATEIARIKAQYNAMETELKAGIDKLDGIQERIVKAKQVANDFNMENYLAQNDVDIEANKDAAKEYTKEAVRADREYENVKNSQEYKNFSKASEVIKIFEDYEKVRTELEAAVTASDHAKAAEKQKELDDLKSKVLNNGIIKHDDVISIAGTDTKLSDALNNPNVSIKDFMGGTVKNATGTVVKNLETIADERSTSVISVINALGGDNKQLKNAISGKTSLTKKELDDIMKKAQEYGAQLRADAAVCTNIVITKEKTKKMYEKQKQFATDKATLSEGKLWKQEANKEATYKQDLKDKTKNFKARWNYWRTSGNGRWKSFWKSIPFVGKSVTQKAVKKQQMALMEAKYQEPERLVREDFKKKIIDEAKKGVDITDPVIANAYKTAEMKRDDDQTR